MKALVKESEMLPQDCDSDDTLGAMKDIHLGASLALVGNILGSQKSRFDELEAGQRRIETLLGDMLAVITEVRDRTGSQVKAKDWYTPAEAAELLGKRPYTVREWCRLHRIEARKRPSGRGEADEWEVSAAEIERYLNHGLLPIPDKY